MNDETALFLSAQEPRTEEQVEWQEGTLVLRVRSFLSGTPPPLGYVTSARAVVLLGDAVLTVRDPGRVHILPGGRRTQGESLEETVRREVLEETGWTLAELRPLGFRHFHHRTPAPTGYRYPYPDFFDLIYTATASEFRSEARETDGWEIEAKFCPVSVVQAAGLALGEAFFLQAALATR